MAATWLAAVAAQNAPTFPVLLSDLTAPAIDRGLRDNDPPRAPRGDRGLVVDDGGAAFLPGSLIVKFRPGTSAEARRLVLAQVDGAAAGPASYANFDIVAIDPTTDPEATALLLDAQPDAYLEHIPLRRFGGPDDLKGAVVFLASRASDYVTGQVVIVDGGLRAA